MASINPVLTDLADRPVPERISLRASLWRLAVLAGLGLFHAALLSLYYDPPEINLDDNFAISMVRQFAGLAVHGGLLVVVAYAVLNWRKGPELVSAWRDALAGHRFGFWLGVNLAALVVTLIASVLVCQSADIYMRWIGPYLALLVAFAMTFLLAAAPLAFWRHLFAETWLSFVFALVTAVLVLGLSIFAQAGWVPLAGVTMYTSYGILSLYESNIFIRVEALELGVNDFVVNIAPTCSGFEGIGLVTAVLGLYLYVFRRELKFPNALFLLPLGVLAIWLLNAVRIAALISLGAHVSPKIAVGGFHSQAGWIAFLIVTGAFMWLGQTAPFFRRSGSKASASAKPLDTPYQTRTTSDDAAAWLAPFMGLMGASIVAAAFVPNDHWLYGLRVVAIGAALWMFRDFYRTLVQPVSWLAIVGGLAVGVAWIATDPDPSAGAALGEWLAALPAWALVLWLVIRALGTVVFVPIAEEMAFRGYLHKKIASLGVATPQIMMIAAFIVTSLLFGAIHQRWLAGMLAGAVYALVMYRSERMADPIAAHMISNAAIIAWAVHQQQWSLL